MTQVLLATADDLAGRLVGLMAKVVATTNVPIAGLPTIDGYETDDGDTVLLTGQTAATQNGPWVTDPGGWTRPPGWETGRSITGGTVVVTAGTANAGTVWALTTTGTVTIDATAQSWVSTPVAGLGAALAAKADVTALTAEAEARATAVAARVPKTFSQVAFETVEHFRYTPNNANTGPFTLASGQGSFGGVADPAVFIGWNTTGVGAAIDGTKSVLQVAWENHYNEGGTPKMEWYVQMFGPGGVTTRPVFANYNKTTGRTENVILQADNFFFQDSDAAGGSQRMKVFKSGLDTEVYIIAPATGGQPAISFVVGATVKWRFYRDTDETLYAYDGVHSRWHMAFVGGTTNTTASSYFQSNVEVRGNLTVLGTIPAALGLSTINEAAVTTTANLTVALMHKCTATSAAYTVTLPTPVGLTGKLIGVRIDPSSTKLVTVATAAGTINGSATRIMWAGESAILQSDGANWLKIAGLTLPMKATIKQASAQAVASATAVTITLDTLVTDNTGLMANLGAGTIVAQRPGNYIVRGRIGLGNVLANASRCISLVLKNGTAVASKEDSYLLGAFPTTATADDPVLAANDAIAIQIYQNSGSSVNTAAGAPQTAPTLSVTEVPTW